MQQIAEWLEKLGLGQYAQRFAENDIDLSILPDLTDEDLKKIGVWLGHRKRILRAIAALHEPALPAEPPWRDEAERRQLTIMFCDLVGSTALSTKLDPEDLQEIIGTYHQCCAKVVTQSGGFVARYLGDGVLAYFGYPQAHEDDAERAVRAGLALVEAVAKLDAGEATSLHVRVGIATGLVVIRGDTAHENEVVGATPNLAARFQALAEPDTVVIGSGTRHLLGGLFDCRDLGAVSVKGFDDAMQVWRVLGPSSVDSRFEALRAAGTPLVDREEEIALLMRHWQRAKTGEGCVVLISGEPGIGKSRIAETVLERVSGEPHTRLRYFCSPHHQDSALYPSITQLERAAGFRREDTAEQRLDKLAAVLALGTNDLSEAVPLLADLLLIPTGGRYPLLSLTPQKRREKTLHAQLAQIEGLAARQSMLVLFEDVHWSDPTSLELLGRVVDRVATLPVLLIVTFRPEFDPPWIRRPHVTALTLNRLGQCEISSLIDGVVGNKPLPASLRRDIIERSDGIPLFVEEMTKAVLEAESEGTAHRTVAAVPSPALAVPASLHASLMARLDRLGPAKEIAQIGAAIGREFSRALLALVVRKPEAELGSALDRLIQTGLLFRQGVPPHATYLFKHALVQDAAYDTLLRSRRQELHARIATVLEQHFPEIVDQQPEFLAKHCTQAGLIETAIDYWGRAGRQSVARSALVEATVQLRKGLDLLVGLPEGPERWRRELQLQSALGGAMYASKGPAASETGQAYARARELCEQVGDTSTLIPVLCGQSTYRLARCELALAHQIAEELLRLVRTRGDTADHLIANRTMGACLFWLGDFALSAKHMARLLDIYVPEVHEPMAPVAVYDMRTVALIYLSVDLFALGYPEQALSRSELALISSRNQSHRQGYAFALSIAALLHLLHRADRKALEVLDELTPLAAEQGFPFWLTVANILRGHVISACGETGAGLALAQKGLADQIAGGSHLNETCYLGLIAQCYERAGEVDEALALLATALETAGATGERWFEAELHRLKGTWLTTHRRGDQEEAEAHLHRAISVAQGQHAKMLELRAATSLARLWRDQGKRQQAHDLLAPIYGWFTEGFDTLDLKEAKALLDQLT